VATTDTADGEELERAEDLLSALVSKPSEQGDRYEQEPAIQAYLEETVIPQAHALGLPTVRDSIGNVVVQVGSSSGPRITMFAYAMTHPAGRMANAHIASVSVDREGRRRVRGRGAAEQKGALASALLAIAWLRAREAALGGEVVLCVSPAGETGRHDAAQTFLDGFGEPRFAWGIVAIGTNSQICVANKGRIDTTVTVRGRSSHSGMPWAGLNAIHGALEVLRRLDAIDLAADHPHLGRATLTPTAINSFPPAPHTVPDEVRIVLDRRLLPGDLPESAVAGIRHALERMEPYQVEVEVGAFMYPSEVAEDSELVGRLQQAFRATVAREAPLRYSHGAIDAGFLNHRGVSAVMFGPGEQELWHTDDESVAVEDIVLCARVMATAAFEGLGPHPMD
jgi:acetylornithine deacetylase/succinyl-diaminopimelate desuccinylase-like protein